MSKIQEQVIDILADELALDADIVTLPSRLNEDLGADSLDMVELVMRFEERFDIEIPNDDAEKLTTVDDIVKYVETRTAV